MSNRKSGIVKFFNEAKGFGFIKLEDNGDEIFVHKSGTSQLLYQDDKVEFDVEQGEKGAFATKVKVV